MHVVVIALFMLNDIIILIVKLFIYLFIYRTIVSFVIFVSAHLTGTGESILTSKILYTSPLNTFLRC